MRAVDADALIVQFRRAIETFLPNDPRRHMNPVNSLKCHGWEQGLVVIQDAPTIHSEPHWIPMTERLPEVKQKVLVQYADESMATKRCNDAGHLAWFYSNAVAWMPAPEPYKGVME